MAETVASYGEFDAHVFSLLTDRQGGLWIGTDGNGIFHLPAGASIVQSVPELEDIRVVPDLFESETGVLWIATSSGVVRYDGHRADRVGASLGLPDNQIHSILADRRGGIWMSGNRGVFRVDAEELESVALGQTERLTPTRFNRHDGMPRSETNGGFQPPAWLDGDGQLWYPTTDGLAVFDPGRVDLLSPPPEPRITRVTVDDTPFDARTTLSIAPGPGRITIDFATPVYARAAHAVEYRGRLAD